MLVVTLVLLLLAILIYKRQQRMSILKRLGIPGPKPNFIFGNLIDIGFGGLNSVFPKWTEKYGPIVGFYFGGRPQVLVTDFDLIRHILVKDFYKFSNRNQCIPVNLLNYHSYKLHEIIFYQLPIKGRNSSNTTTSTHANLES